MHSHDLSLANPKIWGFQVYNDFPKPTPTLDLEPQNRGVPVLPLPSLTQLADPVLVCCVRSCVIECTTVCSRAVVLTEQQDVCEWSTYVRKSKSQAKFPLEM